MAVQLKLSEIASVFVGQTFRGSAEVSPSSNFKSDIFVIQIKDIFEGYLKETNNLKYAAMDKKNIKIFLEENDIVIPLRGSRINAMMYKVKEEKVTTTNQIAIIRIKNYNKILPDYLNWYLNTDLFKEKIDDIKTGSIMTAISIVGLKGIPILIPSISEQYKIIDIYKNWIQQENILKELIINGKKIYYSICMEILSK